MRRISKAVEHKRRVNAKRKEKRNQMIKQETEPHDFIAIPIFVVPTTKSRIVFFEFHSAVQCERQ